MKPTDCPDLPRKLARYSEGPMDPDGAGWERYFDQSPEDRAACFKYVMRDATGGTSEHGRRFARAWLDAHRAAVEVHKPA